MKKMNLTLAAAVAAGTLAAATPYTHQNFLDDPDEFRFAIVPDRTGGDYRGAWTNALAKLNLLRPAFAMTIGDLIPAGWLDEKSVAAQHEELSGMLKKVVPPFYSVVGNHDIAQNGHSKKVWQQHFGPNTYYSFIYRNTLFLALNTQDTAKGDIGDEQYAWIEKTLRDNPGVRWTFLFMHAPHIWFTERWQALEKGALAGRKYTVFGGDWHCYYHARRHGHDYYALSVAGGCSAMGSQSPLERAVLKGPEYGEMDHLAWVTMTKDGPVVANILLDGILPGEYLNQGNTRSDYWTTPIDEPADPAVVAKMAALDKIKKAKFYRWDGRTFDRWAAPGGGAPAAAWTIAGGELRFDATKGASVLENTRTYANFDFHFSFRLPQGAKARVVFDEPGCTAEPLSYEIAGDLCSDRWTFGRLVADRRHVELEIDGIPVRKFDRATPMTPGRVRICADEGAGAFRGIYCFDLSK